MTSSLCAMLVIWREVLVPHFSEDYTLSKLWCTTPKMQNVIIEQTRTLTCNLRPALPTSLKPSAFPPLMSELKNLKHVKLVLLPALVEDTTFYKYLPAVVWEDLPSTVTRIDIPQPDEVLNSDGSVIVTSSTLMDVLYANPHISMVPYVYLQQNNHGHNQIYNAMVNKLLSHTDIKLVQPDMFSYFTAVNVHHVLKLRAMWQHLSDETKLWLRER